MLNLYLTFVVKTLLTIMIQCIGSMFISCCNYADISVGHRIKDQPLNLSIIDRFISLFINNLSACFLGNWFSKKVDIWNIDSIIVIETKENFCFFKLLEVLSRNSESWVVIKPHFSLKFYREQTFITGYSFFHNNIRLLDK